MNKKYIDMGIEAIQWIVAILMVLGVFGLFSEGLFISAILGIFVIISIFVALPVPALRTKIARTAIFIGLFMVTAVMSAGEGDYLDEINAAAEEISQPAEEQPSI
jgi:hypothetical protein